ncbi:3-oxoacyl-(acyl carrier protein) synthase I [Salmonella enterica subsp. enterica serovar Newport str. VA_R100512570]|nr:3-oxoacyl-(acyl carrier protein) synthase I [Salmonella enterica subsp. enterica serovar Newport str. VA_R100512570]
MKRAVITGLGIVSSIGNNQQEVLASLREGRSGITFSQELKDAGMRSQVWGNVKLDTTGLIDRKVVRFMSDASIYAYLSMEQAVADAGLAPEVYQNNPRVGLIAGSGGGSPKFQVFGADAMRSPRGLKAVGPYVVTKAMASGVSACLATPFKIYGVNYSISSACATSAHCIGNAVEQIQLGKQDIVLLAAAKSCAGKWPVSSMRWAHCPPNITIRLKKRPVPMMRTVMGLSSRAVAVWLLSKSWNTLWRAARISMRKSSVTAQHPMAQTWLLRLVKAQYVACRWRCTA